MIRAAAEEDLQAILDIYNEAIIHSTAVYDYKPHTLQDRKQWFADKQAAGDPVLVYESEGMVVGFAAFGQFRAWPAYKYCVEHSIYVGEAGKRKGVGSALLQELIGIATEREYATMVAGIDETNLGSIRLHEKYGFRHAGTIEKAGYKFGRWLNLAFYQLMLPGPSEPKE